MTDSDTITGLLVSALESVWTAIRYRHPDVPDVVLTVGAGSMHGSLTLGHFAPNRWVRGEFELHELFIGGEGLKNGAIDLLGTLLHEATHGVAVTRGIKDTSRQGRWHNDRFRELGEELGLDLARDAKIGWSITTVPEPTRLTYRDQVDELNFALVAHRRSEPAKRGGRKSSNNGIAAECGCGRKIRLSRSAFEIGGIRCEVYETRFAAAEL
ncbi:hypothetical protein [Nocardia brasiliensis]|uniref:hypothetical protein n=1 Tax=Nocardia brasiliensis TaxID=37326 RepID=UPI0024585B69|nr:hypothetical protein [Nocardia brasiliensis]